ncbi:hypothetical protein M011DRAFT_118697 [Sporormia fimetaria CBS 119925]|uniref:Uncharacterized protein n=1 Tax=Sporormia fimetaria CBS 119925 TaxID=1340428 RepID=A0A6A6VLR5_9PLEO|nr:hypothetical protein M011DRAFT_118697 [Sporormia fimetaria CBS 119925]
MPRTRRTNHAAISLSMHWRYLFLCFHLLSIDASADPTLMVLWHKTCIGHGIIQHHQRWQAFIPSFLSCFYVMVLLILSLEASASRPANKTQKKIYLYGYMYSKRVQGRVEVARVA